MRVAVFSNFAPCNLVLTDVSEELTASVVWVIHHHIHSDAAKRIYRRTSFDLLLERIHHTLVASWMRSTLHSRDYTYA
jgi:hypothetical protein